MATMSDLSAPCLYCAEDAGDVVSSSSDADTGWISGRPPPPDEYTIDRLLDLEPHHIPLPDYLRRCRDRSIDLTARQDSIDWILKVHAHYHFGPVTAFLSVNYFDRFLSAHSLPANGWPFQLLSVACLSLAAKMEEPYVPVLIDLQVSEPRFVFEPKTVRRMELFVMAKLHWRLRSVTPFDYLDYFTHKISYSNSQPDPFTHIFSTSSDLIINTTRVIDFLDFSPSIVAAAAVIYAAGEGVAVPEDFYGRINKEMVKSCHQLMEEYSVDTCQLPKPEIVEPPAPPSPAGVLDAAACASCDTRSENPHSGSGSGSGQVEPPSKRLRFSAPDVQGPQP
ncbi:hypothetical protein RJ639_033411 [Escallonia herrerae]|uniref:Cyclin N-terminal domain-containing protein n=1 Tax=Escallonia herrerae TaxID=1293975 RepID=A0AA88WY96_9ASTE|nr:hypothetical protein RJ639_033411 [Escallonia herrerae]